MIVPGYITNLPEEQVVEILNHLDGTSLGRFSQLSRQFLKIASKEPLLWKSKFITLNSIDEISQTIKKNAKDFLFIINPRLPRDLEFTCTSKEISNKMLISAETPGLKKAYLLKKFPDDKAPRQPIDHLIFPTLPLANTTLCDINLKIPFPKNSWRESAKIKTVFDVRVHNNAENTDSLYRITGIMEGRFLKNLDCHVVKLDFYSFKEKKSSGEVPKRG